MFACENTDARAKQTTLKVNKKNNANVSVIGINILLNTLVVLVSSSLMPYIRRAERIEWYEHQEEWWTTQIDRLQRQIWMMLIMKAMAMAQSQKNVAVHTRTKGVQTLAKHKNFWQTFHAISKNFDELSKSRTMYLRWRSMWKNKPFWKS